MGLLSADLPNLIIDCGLVDRPYLLSRLVGLSSADLQNLIIDCGLHGRSSISLI